MSRAAKIEEMKKRYAENEENFGDKERLPTLKWSNKETKIIRLIPAKSLLKKIVDAEKFIGYDADIDEDIPLPVRELDSHWLDKIRVTCPKCLKSLPCPLCEQAEELKDSADEDDQETYDNIRTKHQCTYFAIDRGNEEKGPHWLYFSPKWNKKIIGIMSNPDFGDIDHPEDGFDLTVTRTGMKRGDTDYDIQARRNPTYLASVVKVEDGEEFDYPDWDTMKKWCDAIIDIHTEYANELFTYDEIVSLSRDEIDIKELYENRKETKDSDETPKRSREEETSSKRRRRRE